MTPGPNRRSSHAHGSKEGLCSQKLLPGSPNGPHRCQLAMPCLALPRVQSSRSVLLDKPAIMKLARRTRFYPARDHRVGNYLKVRICALTLWPAWATPACCPPRHPPTSTPASRRPAQLKASCGAFVGPLA